VAYSLSYHLGSFSFTSHRDNRHLHSFPTRRSSDLHLSISLYTFSIGAKAANNRLMPFCGKAISSSKSSLFPVTFTTVPTPQILRSEEHTSELQLRFDIVCRLLLEKKKKININSRES